MSISVLRRYKWLALFLGLFSVTAQASQLNDFFSEKVSFNPAIPTPASVLGYEVGEWHVRHDQVVKYLQLLAEKSPRMTLEVIGYTHEQRPLLQLLVTAPDKQQQLASIRNNRMARLHSGAKAGNDDPLVVMLGYSVHGNEASGTNAALLFCYYLAAAEGEVIEQYLKHMVIIVDPSFNPDGLDRFASWVNRNKSKTLNSDPNNRLHNEPWPSSRTNHYWFDLNRDWLMLRHPESQARNTRYHQWKPHVVADFHEMGSNSSFFFQPGILSRKNPMTPPSNVELTKAITEYHAKAFDRSKVLYFSQESYDDFYAGKGSTYPDLNGGIGILFEQGSARGFVRDTINGQLSFDDAIKNQLSASLATLQGAEANRLALLNHQLDFYQQYKKLASEDETCGYLLSEHFDHGRLNQLLALLQAHQIEVYPLTKDLKANNRLFEQGSSYYVPLRQPQYRLIKSIFSQQKSFEDNTFYDVSNWNLAWAFNINFEPITSNWGLKYAMVPWQQPSAGKMPQLKDAYGYAISWDDQRSARLLQKLLDQNIQVRVASQSFSGKMATGNRKFEPGTLLINAALQKRVDWLQVLQQAQDEVGIPVESLYSGFTSNGIDLGSNAMIPVLPPKVLLVGGSTIDATEVGEVWHYLDTFLQLAPSIVALDRLAAIDMSYYSHIILVDGNYSSVPDPLLTQIKQWVRAGGVIWGQKNAAQWLAEKELLKVHYTTALDLGKRFATTDLKYADQVRFDARKQIAGAVFSVELDLTHPLTYGYQQQTLPVFKNSTLVLNKSSKPFIAVGNYSKFPQMGGYAAPEIVEKIADSSFMVAHSLGRGLVIGVADDVNFRGFWYGTSRLLSNALYFSRVVKVAVE